MLEQHFGDVNVTPSANPATALYDASDLDLAISLSRDNWVRQRANPKMSVALTGDFRLKKAPHADPQMTGRIAPVPNRGFVEEFARSFDIASGEILLNGSMNQHHVDIQAQYKPPTSSESGENQTVITLEIEGRIDQMKLTLSSDPPMSEVEIVNYIATGKSAADRSRTSSGEDSGALARDIGLATISGGAEQAAQQAIGLDVLQVRFDPLLGATLVAGRYVDPELYVGFRQPLQYKQSGTATTSDVASTSVEVEYAIHQWLVVNLQAETSKVRSFIRARHAY
jgi:translocation and assembly module TamB